MHLESLTRTRQIRINQVTVGMQLAIPDGDGHMLFIVDSVKLNSTRDDQGNTTNTWTLTSTKAKQDGKPWVIADIPDGTQMLQVLPPPPKT
jgi:hypothetical protein